MKKIVLFCLILLVATPAVLLSQSAGRSGEEVYNSICAGCHKSGLAGAPVVGNKDDWAPRIARGIDSLYNSALNGKGSMPAKGGQPALSNTEVKGAVDYMVGQSQ